MSLETVLKTLVRLVELYFLIRAILILKEISGYMAFKISGV